MKIAKQLAKDTAMVRLPDGRQMLAERALREGYEIVPHDHAAVTTGQAAVSAASEWRRAIYSAPEAHGRDSATAELVSANSPETMTVEAARAFLRGLPVEKAEAPRVAAPAVVDPRAARLAEINASVREFNRSRGHAVAKLPAPALETVEPAKLKRLAEIRLAAITMRVEQGERRLESEQRRLSYAMSVHGQTGMPLANVFKQLGVDTSKLFTER